MISPIFTKNNGGDCLFWFTPNSEISHEFELEIYAEKKGIKNRDGITRFQECLTKGSKCNTKNEIWNSSEREYG